MMCKLFQSIQFCGGERHIDVIYIATIRSLKWVLYIKLNFLVLVIENKNYIIKLLTTQNNLLFFEFSNELCEKLEAFPH